MNVESMVVLIQAGFLQVGNGDQGWRPPAVFPGLGLGVCRLFLGLRRRMKSLYYFLNVFHHIGGNQCRSLFLSWCVAGSFLAPSTSFVVFLHKTLHLPCLLVEVRVPDSMNLC